MHVLYVNTPGSICACVDVLVNGKKHILTLLYTCRVMWVGRPCNGQGSSLAAALLHTGKLHHVLAENN